MRSRVREVLSVGMSSVGSGMSLKSSVRGSSGEGIWKRGEGAEVKSPTPDI